MSQPRAESAPADVAFPGSPVLPQTFDEDKTIRLRCHRGIACWNASCRNIDLSLTPYDILRLKRRPRPTASEFPERYTVPYRMEQDGIAGVKRGPVAEGTACQCMVLEDCAVYGDRPTACGYCPVAPHSLRRQEESTGRDSYALVKAPHCLDHDEPHEITIGDYRREQVCRSTTNSRSANASSF